MGGASLIQQVRNALLADELLLYIAPVLLVAGTALFDHIGGRIRLERMSVPSEFATHVRSDIAYSTRAARDHLPNLEVRMTEMLGKIAT
jgi:dihydrofolate reductase